MDNSGDEWTPEIVEPLAKIIPTIGENVEKTFTLVEAARASDVGIRNESALRYEVPLTVWDGGMSISDWVAQISESVN